MDEDNYGAGYDGDDSRTEWEVMKEKNNELRDTIM